MSKRLLAAAFGAAVIAVPFAGVAAAQDIGPGSDACVSAEAALAAAVAVTVTYSPDVYPGGTVPAVDDVTPEFLAAVLADPDLGGDARVEVLAAVEAFAARDKACADPAPTTPPAPTSLAPTSPAPTSTAPTSSAPADDLNCDDLAPLDAQAVLDADPSDPNGLDADGDGFACDADDDADYDQVTVVPRGGVETGG